MRQIVCNDPALAMPDLLTRVHDGLDQAGYSEPRDGIRLQEVIAGTMTKVLPDGFAWDQTTGEISYDTEGTPTITVDPAGLRAVVLSAIAGPSFRKTLTAPAGSPVNPDPA